MQFRRRAELLSFEELTRLVTLFATLGVRRVRLTGGEPTVRADVVDLVAMLAQVPGLDEVVMTSNGERFPSLAEPLARAGLRGVNVSLDTLDPNRFRELTRRGDLDTVVRGIDAARAAGLEVKLNAVALQGINHGELADLCRFAWQRDIVVRFIEHMPMSSGSLFQPSQQLTAAEIRASLEAAFDDRLVPVTPRSASVGPARYWALASAPERHVGIISAMSEHFCATCNRLRLSATGELHSCLAYDDATSLREVMRGGGSNAHLAAAIRAAVTGKREGHRFQSTGDGGPTKHMIAIGG